MMSAMCRRVELIRLIQDTHINYTKVFQKRKRKKQYIHGPLAANMRIRRINCIRLLLAFAIWFMRKRDASCLESGRRKRCR